MPLSTHPCQGRGAGAYPRDAQTRIHTYGQFRAAN